MKENHRFLLKISQSVKDKCKSILFLKNFLAENLTGQDLFEFSDAHMLEMYEAANTFLSEKRYSDAANSFLFLASLKDSPDYWIGFGISMQMTGDFEMAITAYEIAASCDVENPWPYYYLAKAFFAVYERQSAIEALELTISYAEDDSRYEQLKLQAIEAKKLLEESES